MKRLKFWLSSVMMVACIAVLCVGVLSLSPIENTIGGTITISAASARLQISTFVNNEQVTAPTKTVSGLECDLSEKLSFDASDATSVDTVPQKIVRIRIQNLTDNELGVYFYNGSALGPDGLATYSCLMHNDTINRVVDGEETNEAIASVIFSTYTYLAPNDDADGGYDEIDMYATIDILTLDDVEMAGSFNYVLKVEDYSPNVTTENYSTTATNDIVKFSSTYGSTARTSITSTTAIAGNTNAKVVVLPSTITTIGESAFANCTSLEHIIIPNSVTSMGAKCFDTCSSLVSVSTPISGALNHMSVYEGEFDIYPFAMFFGTTQFEGSWESGYSGEYESFTYGYVPNSLNMIYFTKNIKAWALENYAGNVIIGENVTGLEYYGTSPSASDPVCGAFMNAKVKKLFIPKNITDYGYNTFYGCDKLASITFEEGCSIGHIGVDGWVYYFSGCKSLRTLILPGVTSISPYSFSGCKNLEILIFEGTNSISFWDTGYLAALTSLKYLRIPSWNTDFTNGGQLILPTPSASNFKGWALNGDTENLVAGGSAIPEGLDEYIYEAIFE